MDTPRRHRRHSPEEIEILLRAECAAEDCAEQVRPRNGARGGLPKYCSPQCAKRQNHRDHDRRARYAVHSSTLGDYDRLFMEQEGRCGICGSTDPNGRRGLTRFAFDHDHETNRARGLLCYLCNVGLGSFQDDPELLQAAISYLEKHAPNSGAAPVAVTPHREKVS